MHPLAKMQMRGAPLPPWTVGSEGGCTPAICSLRLNRTKLARARCGLRYCFVRFVLTRGVRLAHDDGAAPAVPPAVYSGKAEHVSWDAYALGEDVVSYLRQGVLKERVSDIALRDQIEADIREAAVSDVADELVRELLKSEPDPEPWQIGEAMAEVLLGEWHDAIWVWNQGRDRRTPKASLPGADLVGFLATEDGGARFLFGEVKSSEDADAPPNVLYGRHGMIYQLEELAARTDLVWTLITWLRARCTDGSALEAYRSAMAAHAKSRGKDLVLAGCLLRDTPPNEMDVKNRGKALAKTVSSTTSVHLRVWHLPDKLSNWVDYLEVAGDG